MPWTLGWITLSLVSLLYKSRHFHLRERLVGCWHLVLQWVCGRLWLAWVELQSVVYSEAMMNAQTTEFVVFVSPPPLTWLLWVNPLFWQGGAGGAAVSVFVWVGLQWGGLLGRFSFLFFLWLQLVDGLVVLQEGSPQGEWHSRLFVFYTLQCFPTPSLCPLGLHHSFSVSSLTPPQTVKL